MAWLEWKASGDTALIGHHPWRRLDCEHHENVLRFRTDAINW
jgi:hypothetical protein